MSNTEAVDQCAMCGRVEEDHGSRGPDGSIVKPAPGVKSHQFISSRNLRDTKTEAVRLAEDAWSKLLRYAREGLPSCYNGSANEMMYDWWPDLPWPLDQQRIAVQHLQQKPSAEFQLIREKLGLDMAKEFNHAVQLSNSTGI